MAEPASFATFYRERWQPMVRLAFLLTGGSPVAEELVQEAFLRVHARWSRIDHPSAYLRQAVVHATASHRRRADLEQRKGIEYRPEAEDEPENLRRPVDDLRDAVSRLPDRQRAAVVLRYYEDLSDAEIAEALGCRVPAVKSLLHRALKDLRKVVEP